MPWTPLTLAWLDRGAQGPAPIGGVRHRVAVPPRLWDYGDTSAVMDAPSTPRLIAVELDPLEGRMAVSLVSPNGSTLLTAEAVVAAGEGRRTLLLEHAPASGPGRLLFRNAGVEGEAGSGEIFSLSWGELADAPADAELLRPAGPAAGPQLDGGLRWIARADERLIPISLGNACETKFQIARVLHERRTGRLAGAGFRLRMVEADRGREVFGWDAFDWQGTPAPALLRLLTDDFAGAYERADLEPFGEDVRNRALRTTHLHDYESALPPGTKAFSAEAIDRNFAAARAGFERRAQAFRRHLREPGPFLYVHASEDFPDAWTTANLIERLRAGDPGHRFRLLVVSQGPADPTMDGLGPVLDRALRPNATRKPKERLWEGDDEAWDAALAPYTLAFPDGSPAEVPGAVSPASAA